MMYESLYEVNVKKTFVLSLLAVAAVIPVLEARALDPAPQGMKAGLYMNVAADKVAGAQSFIQSMAQRGIDFLSDEKLTQEQRKQEFRQLLRSSYDMRTIGRFALGTYWKTASKQQQEEYQTLFEKKIVEVYSARFSEYKGQQLEVTVARAEGDTDTIVTSYVLPSKGGEKVQVDWRVRNKGGQYKVIDVIVAGVSMAMTQRSDFASVIQRGGGDVNVLLDHLRNPA
jgi:phospholipid transport system substrate-binding protein